MKVRFLKYKFRFGRWYDNRWVRAIEYARRSVMPLEIGRIETFRFITSP